MRDRHRHRDATGARTIGTPAAGPSVLVYYRRSVDADQMMRQATELLLPDVTVKMRSAPAIEAIRTGAHEHRATLLVPSGERAAAAELGGPIFICFDGSEEARCAVCSAGELLALRDAIVAAFLEPVDDVALLRTTLPWSPSAATQGRLARLDQREAEFLTQLSTEGAALAGNNGLRARPLAIDGIGPAGDALLEAAAAARASCIVVGHRSSATPIESTALELVRHACRPVLVVPR
jgi:hypothetical protein